MDPLSRPFVVRVGTGCRIWPRQEPTAALDEVARDLERRTEHAAEYFGFPALKDPFPRFGLRFNVVVEREGIEPRDDAFLAQFWELGIDGTYMLTKDKKTRAVLPGSASFTRSLNRPGGFSWDAAKQGKMPFKRPWLEAGSWFEMFRTIHYTELPDNGNCELNRGFKEILQTSVTL